MVNEEELNAKIKSLKEGKTEFKELSHEEVEKAFELGLLKVRKLTPRECGRLMDVPEWAIDRIESSGVSRSQQYKCYGNSIVVACMFHCFMNLFGGCEDSRLFEDDLFPGYNG